jgi:hypothetical protein
MSRNMKLSELKESRSWVFYVNVIMLQWFFVRLARVFDEDSGEQVGWTLIVRAPLTGWLKDGR